MGPAQSIATAILLGLGFVVDADLYRSLYRLVGYGFLVGARDEWSHDGAIFILRLLAWE
jgi:hypothetical protein